jgi:hypothetical protein
VEYDSKWIYALHKNLAESAGETGGTIRHKIKRDGGKGQMEVKKCLQTRKNASTDTECENLTMDMRQKMGCVAMVETARRARKFGGEKPDKVRR